MTLTRNAPLRRTPLKRSGMLRRSPLKRTGFKRADNISSFKLKSKVDHVSGEKTKAVGDSRYQSGLKRTGFKKSGRFGWGRKIGKVGRRRIDAWKRVVAQCFARRGLRCELHVDGQCLGVASHGHHWLPRQRGGPDTTQNCKLTCGPCHIWVHENPAKARELGLMLASSDERALEIRRAA